jgi:hypothetical protein
MLNLLCLMLGTAFGVFLSALMDAGKRADESSERTARRHVATKNAHQRSELH